ncbi:TspO/MBR family protein [Enterococcus gallinarum]|uniref:TspO/MBR family protein n=1 Tax=Enterococcus gallinarum TaxID=1353 RepID=UPI0035D9D95D
MDFLFFYPKFLFTQNILHSHKKEKKKVIYIYGVQLFFNFSWSIIFFNIQYMKVAILIVVFLLFMVGYQITIFSKNNKLVSSKF